MTTFNTQRVDFTELLKPPRAVSQFVDKLTRGLRFHDRRGRNRGDSDRREANRYLLPIRVDVQPVDSGFNPCGESYPVVARDISASGIGIRDTRKVTSKYLAMLVTAPSGEQMKMLTKVVRCNQSGKIYDIGGRFVNYTHA